MSLAKRWAEAKEVEMKAIRLRRDIEDEIFDEVLALRVEKDAEGISQRALMCDSDGLWLAKDRSGKLSPWEEPNLGDIIAKIASRS